MRVVLTGAAKGIGEAILLRLAPKVETIWCLDVDERRLREAVDRASEGGADVRAIVCDVGEPSLVDRGWDQIGEAGALVTACINNAAIFPWRAAVDVTATELERVLAVNVGGAFHMARNCARRLIQAEAPGSIVSVASGQAFRPVPNAVAYATSKAAIVNLGRALAAEWGPNGIRVNTVVPGLTRTDQPLAHTTEAEFEAVAASVPLRRLGTPNEIADTVDFLLSDSARFITGQAIAVNGGAVML